YILIAGNGDSIYKRLMKLIGRDDLGNDPELARNPGRVRHMSRIDAAIAKWSAAQSMVDALDALGKAGVPAGKVFTVKDIVEDEQYQARDMIREITLHDGSSLKVPGVVPKLSATPGRFSGGGPLLGEHTDSVLTQLGLGREELERLKKSGVI